MKRGITKANISGNIPKMAAFQRLNFFFLDFNSNDLKSVELHNACEIISIKKGVICSLKIHLTFSLYLYNLKIYLLNEERHKNY